MGRITAHPRFLRFLGTCSDSNTNEVYILSDYVAGISLEVVCYSYYMFSFAK